MKNVVFVILFLIELVFGGTFTPMKMSPEFLSKISQKNIQPRIVSGSYASRRQFPYQVGLSLGVSELYFWCGGSVISDRYVLTAGHCVEEVTSIFVIFGASDRSNQYEAGQVRMHIKTIQDGVIIVHPHFNPKTLVNDIALIRLPQRLEFSEYIQPAKLPISKDSYKTYIKTTAVISGWGKTGDSGAAVNHLQYGYVEIMDLNDCIDHFLPGLVNIGNICTDPKKSEGVSSCRGDSGGPLVSTVTGELIGVTSFGSTSGCENGAPGGYTSVSYYRDWIEYHTGI